jgi:transposase
MATEGRIERWKRRNRDHLRQYQRDYYRERKRRMLEEQLKRVRAQVEAAAGMQLNSLRLEAKEIGLKLDRLRLQERNEKGAA